MRWDGSKLVKIILGFAIAPLVPALALLVVAIFLHGIDRFDQRNFMEGIWVIMFVGAISYPIAFLLGLPILVVAIRFGFARWYHCLIVGLLIGAVVGSFFGLARTWLIDDTVWSFTLKAAPSAIIFMIWGSVVAISFWLIARPDRYLEDRGHKSH